MPKGNPAGYLPNNKKSGKGKHNVKTMQEMARKEVNVRKTKK